MEKESGRSPAGNGSVGFPPVIHPTGNSEARVAARPGHQGREATTERPVELPPAEGSVESSRPGKTSSPGHAAQNGQSGPVLKAHSLIDKVYRWDNLYRAWRRVRANKGTHGLDRVTIRHFEKDWELHLREIQRKLRQRGFIPQPVRRAYIPKTSNPKQRRPLGIPVVADRIVGQALIQVLDPLFDPFLSDQSFAYRKGRSAHDAVIAVIQARNEGFRYLLDADIKSFFDLIDHQVIMSCVRRRIADGRVLNLIEAFLKAGVVEHGRLTVPSQGTPQGGVISPWLANLVLDDFDKAIEGTDWRLVRYADDLLVLCRNPQEAEHAMVFVRKVLARMKLVLNEEKSRLTDFSSGFEFLGFHFHGHHIGIRSSSLNRFRDKVRRLTRRQQGRSIDAVIADLNPVVRGWAGYFGKADVSCTFTALDAWIRMRIRSYKFKRRCRNDNWRLPNKRLAKWGLLSLRECSPKTGFHSCAAIPT